MIIFGACRSSNPTSHLKNLPAPSKTEYKRIVRLKNLLMPAVLFDSQMYKTKSLLCWCKTSNQNRISRIEVGRELERYLNTGLVLSSCSSTKTKAIAGGRIAYFFKHNSCIRPRFVPFNPYPRGIIKLIEFCPVYIELPLELSL